MRVKAMGLALLAGLAPMAFANTEGWYQIDVVVFANETSTETDEVWPLTEKSYPANMISIAPEAETNIRPATMGQLQDLQSYLDLWLQTNDRQTTPGSDFLFQSRHSQPVTQATEQTDNTATDTAVLEPEEAVDFEALFAEEGPTALKNLPARERLLGGVARSLRRSSMYRLLLHNSWVQPINNEARATPVLIQAGKRYDDHYELDGTITISRSRFLHVDTDLWFTEFTPLHQSVSANPGTGFSALPLNGRETITADLKRQYPEVAEWLSGKDQYLPVHSHHLAQSRRMRSATLHFIDHPRFGVLIRIDRYEGELSAQ